MRFWLTVAAMLTLLGLASRFGRAPERLAAATLGANFLVALLNGVIFGPVGFDHLDPVLATADSATLVALTWIALNANRIWPLIAAALQLLVVAAHISVRVSVGWDQVYWGMMAIAQYMQLIVVMGGTLNHHQRERQTGPYRSWRLAHR